MQIFLHPMLASIRIFGIMKDGFNSIAIERHIMTAQYTEEIVDGLLVHCGLRIEVLKEGGEG